MKKLFLFAATICTMFSSCSNSDGVDLGNSEEEIITVSLALGGELRETQTPMSSTTRAESNDLYGIQIKANGQYYAWGIFDDLSGVTVDLSVSKEYHIEVTYVPNGKNLIYNYGDNTNVCYEIPLNTDGWSKTSLNKFNYTSNEYLWALGYAEIYVARENGKYIPMARGNNGSHNEVDFYHGSLWGYIPLEGGNMVVDMKRHVCALEFVAKAVDGYNYDKILLQLDTQNVLHEEPKPYYMTKQSDGTYSTVDLPLVMMGNLGEEDTMTISIGTDDRPEEIFHGQITLKRLVKHTFEFDAMPYEEKINNGIDIKKDGAEFTNETSSL
ncbi:MAG: hypothetical protein IKY25_04510 [Alistipes sp.]|nr:hypothetical protein [Alistipes sp.]